MIEENFGIYLLIAMVAMAISMAVVPLMMRIAPAIGMIDTPDSRKVHSEPIPRVGGLGIVIGAMVPMLIWLPFTDLAISIFLGAIILLVFGTWDDIAELGHYVKFIGQFAAACIVVYYGDLYVSHFPLYNYETISESVGRPFTVIAIVGMINAINHSDGLDGLAGGESLISLSVITYLAFIFDSSLMLVISAATIGGIFGFLRFNSHPARVFMGDAGSQFLGFILAILVVILMQQVNSALSPSIAILLLGLPIVDILAVFFLRAKHKMNLFKATRNHIHHRLLDIGFLHYESVMFIYTVQFVLVISAVFLMYENDVLGLLYYLAICLSVFVFLTVSERRGFKVHNNGSGSRDLLTVALSRYPHLEDLPMKAIEAGLSLFIVASALVVSEVPADFAISSLVLLLLLVLILLTNLLGYQLYRLILFVTIGFSIYLLTTYPVDWLSNQIDLIFVYFILMGLMGFVAVKTISGNEFRITPLDYLVIAIALLIEVLPGDNIVRENIIWMIVQMIILFYIAELLIQNMRSRLNRFTGSMILALSLIAYRGLV
ncbi:Undecaprenyl-phosphate alpha-N-acetylglucosaminyl 1-phosphate transferase [hydrothermal vent metagenome]|uniref:Undecaprenyl-phosphate alpha-N-acetylglucosaminyl 1-phosphate transferase n=1 Tax=hydrothermal vent metagenome TaxID=652676 RepID=A0A3B0W495_9ZZZZ